MANGDLGAIDNQLKGADRDAFEAMRDFFRRAGFSPQDIQQLSAAVTGFLQEGYSGDTVTMLLNETEPYKRRFGVVNEERKKRGLSQLKPGEIVGLEDEYKGLFRQYGLPQNMFDSHEDFVSYIGGDVSPAEMQSRLDIARSTVNSDNEATRETYRSWYASGLTEGDAIAAVLDPDRALPELERKARSAMLGGAAQTAGLGMSRSRAEYLSSFSETGSQAVRQFGSVVDVTRNAGAIAARYDMDGVSQEDAEDAVFLNDSDARERIRRLGSREAAEFGGRGGLGDSRSLGSARY